MSESAERRLKRVQEQFNTVAAVPRPLSLWPTAAAAGASDALVSVRPSAKRAVIVLGARTAFAKSFTDLRKNDAISLGVSAVQGVLQKAKLDPSHVDQLIMGNVVVMTAAPNLAREIVIDLNLPRKIPGTTVSVACLSGLEAIAQAVLFIEHGDSDVVIAGGSDSLSNGELTMPRKFTQALAKYQMGGGNKKGYAGFMELLKEAGPPNTWMPTPNSIAERSTGKTMGYHADVMAELNQIARQDQDQFAAGSHQKAAKAQKDGKLAQEIVAVQSVMTGKTFTQDNLIRGSSKPEKMAQLPPVFRPAPVGTVTAASSSPLTDGASAVLVMSETKASQLGYPTDIIVRSYAKTAIDPHPQLLIAPVVAIYQALQKAGLQLSDIDLFEIHEAFAAQVLSTIKLLDSQEWCQKVLGISKPVGKIDLNKVNPNGSSIAIGHPFAATGGRLVTSAINELRRTGKHLALISICAAGGIGGVMILERKGK